MAQRASTARTSPFKSACLGAFQTWMLPGCVSVCARRLAGNADGSSPKRMLALTLGSSTAGEITVSVATRLLVSWWLVRFFLCVAAPTLWRVTSRQ
jgi:hypothetical protein